MKVIIALSMTMLLLLVGCGSPSRPSVTPAEIKSPVRILTENKLTPVVGIPYSRKLEASEPVKWTAVLSNLPDGLKFNTKTGTIEGVAVKYGEIGNITVEARADTRATSASFLLKVIDTTWLNGQIDIGNFHPGARAEYVVEVHNDESVEVDRLIVTTDETDTTNANGTVTVPIRLRHKLHDGDIRSVSVTGDKGTLTAIRYNTVTEETLITGFLPLTRHEIAITYVSDAYFLMVFEGMSSPPEIADMVTIDPVTFYLAPHETREVQVVLEMPEDYKLPDGVTTFAYYIVVGKASVVSVGGVSANIRYAGRTTVRMR